MAFTIKPASPTNTYTQPDNDATWTLPNVQKDFADWRAGRHRYAVWAIDLDHDWLREASNRMRRHCADLLLPNYARQPHITLHICGFPGRDRRLGDDYTQVDFSAQIRALESVRLKPFSITIGALDTFTTAPYFSVLDIEGGIARARRATTLPAGDGPGDKGFPYVPHVTFGLYGGRFPMPDVTRRLNLVPRLENVHVTVKQITLMTYEASVIAGALTSVCAFDLESQIPRRWKHSFDSRLATRAFDLDRLIRCKRQYFGKELLAGRAPAQSRKTFLVIQAPTLWQHALRVLTTRSDTLRKLRKTVIEAPIVKANDLLCEVLRFTYCLILYEVRFEWPKASLRYDFPMYRSTSS